MMQVLELDVVFSGSSTKLSGHLGAAGYLESQPDVIVRRLAGTSGGSIVAALWATMGIQEAAKIIKEIKYGDYFQFNWKTFLSFLLNGYATSGWRYYRDLEKYFGDTTFDDVDADLSVVVSNMTLGKAEVWSKKTHGPVRLRDALYVSTCIPGIFKPISLFDQVYRDGGVYWNFPINIWPDYPRPRLGFLFQGDWTPRASDSWNGLKELRMAIDRAIDANVDLSVQAAKQDPTTFCVELDSQGLGPLDFGLSDEQVAKLFDGGWNSAAKELVHVKRLAEINDWYTTI